MGAGYLLSLDGASRENLTASRQAYESACRSREIYQGARWTTVKECGFLVAAHFGLDNRELLPPFFPNLRMEDGLFSMTLRAAAPRHPAGLPPPGGTAFPRPAARVSRRLPARGGPALPGAADAVDRLLPPLPATGGCGGGAHCPGASPGRGGPAVRMRPSPPWPRSCGAGPGAAACSTWRGCWTATAGRRTGRRTWRRSSGSSEGPHPGQAPHRTGRPAGRPHPGGGDEPGAGADRPLRGADDGLAAGRRAGERAERRRGGACWCRWDEGSRAGGRHASRPRRGAPTSPPAASAPTPGRWG